MRVRPFVNSSRVEVLGSMICEFGRCAIDAEGLDDRCFRSACEVTHKGGDLDALT